MDPTELLTPTVLIPIAVVLVILIGVGIGVVKVMAGKKSAKSLEQWMHGAYSIWTGGEDCGTWAQDRAQKSLSSWYGANGPGQVWEVIGGLRGGQTGNVAWDRVRALDLLRIGFAARYFDADQCATEGGKICLELQSQYRSWEELAQAFEVGMQAWQRSRGVSDTEQTGKVQKNLPKLRQQIWPQIRYEARLATDD